MPICAFDIDSDGTAVAVSDPDPAATGTGLYRWLHFDLADPALPGWTAAHLPDIAARSVLQSETRPRCDAYQDGLIVNLRGVNLNPEGPLDQMVALRMWVTAGTIVTVRMRKIYALDGIRRDSAAGKGPGSIAAFLGVLSEELTHSARDAIIGIEQQADDLEDAFEEDGGDPDLSQLQTARRMVIRLRRYLSPQREALMRLASIDSPAFAASPPRLQIQEAGNIAALTNEALESLAHRLVALQDFADAQAARRRERNNYVLSVVAAIFLPLGFVTGLFGVNIAGMPGMDTPWAFAALCGGLLAMGLGSLIFLKWLKLL